MTANLNILIEPASDADYVRIRGSMLAGIAAELNTALLNAKLKTAVAFDFADVTVISSSGVREWVAFLARFQVGKKVRFIHCPHGVIGAIGMVPPFAGAAKIASFLVDFRCTNCGLDHRAVADLDKDVKGDDGWMPNETCPRCAKEVPPLTPIADVLEIILARREG